MIFEMKGRGRDVSSSRIGSRNIRPYFSENIPTIDPNLDSTQIQCNPGHNFRHDKPKMADPGLCAGLAEKAKVKASGDTTILLMLATGRSSFQWQSRRARRAVGDSSPYDSAA
jgi:hypothetical protein